MNTPRSKVSVCLPVYNGENFVREAIRSVLEQTFEDFELVISDNASTDATEAICREAATRDRRVRYFRSDVNRGMAWNYNRVFTLANGQYVMWFAHDDLLAPQYLDRCVEVLERDRGVVLCFANTNYIDDKGSVIKQLDYRYVAGVEKPSWRFHQVLHDYMCDPVFGLMKRAVLKQTRLHGGYADSDRVLLAEMALRGRFGVVPEYLFGKRYHPLRNTDRYTDIRERTLVYDPRKAGKLFFPVMEEAGELLSAIHRVRLPLKERLRALNHLSRWLWGRRRRVLSDLSSGLKSIA